MARNTNISGFGATSERRGKNYSGGMQTFTDPDTGKAARGGRLVSRRQRYYDIRVAMGLAGG